MDQVIYGNKDEFYRLLETALAEHLPGDTGRAAQLFARRYFSAIGMDDLKAQPFEDLLGNTLSVWRLLDQFVPEEPKVLVFNPEFEQQGWHCKHTVIEILHADMPFLVDSVRMRLNNCGLSIHFLQNTVLEHVRDATGLRQLDGEGSAQREALMHIQVDRIEEPERRAQLASDLAAVLADVRRVVAGFTPICARVRGIIDNLSAAPDNEERGEMIAFLEWLLDNNFTFLGFEELECSEVDGREVVRLLPESSLGLLKPERQGCLHQADLEPILSRDLHSRTEEFSFSKAAVHSTVHRHAYPDFIVVKKLDAQGAVLGEARIMGLYTSPVYTQSPRQIPWLRKKVAFVLASSGLEPGQHLGKELTQILEVFPRDELFQTEQGPLAEIAMSILQIQERRKVRVFLREGYNGLFVSVLVFVPRDIYSTELRNKMQGILTEQLQALDSEFTTYFSESLLARVHFILRLKPGGQQRIDAPRITRELVQAAYSWDDQLADALLEAKGEGLGTGLLKEYRGGFSAGYRDIFSPRTAVVDIDYCEELGEGNSLALSFYKRIDDAERQLRFKVYHLGGSLALSRQIPILENMGLRVESEYPYMVRRSSGEEIWIHDFLLTSADDMPVVDVERVNRIFKDAFRRIWYGEVENDAFNRLVLVAGMNWREVIAFRAYARYMKQIRLGFSQGYIAQTLCCNTEITHLLLNLFSVRFDPHAGVGIDERVIEQDVLAERIIDALDEVRVLSQDRILRRYLDLVRATLRTNFFQSDGCGKEKLYVSFKFAPREIPEMPKPRPLFEIFVYSARIEGVHLRGGKVARGGLRWSDRIEDYRTEVLGLVKAQQVKNAVIVPVGAKGGFVAKQLPGGDREAMMVEGVACYKTFIRGLLDLTDNLVEGGLVHPQALVRYDEDDPYLVVAADKGTATFSDLANGVAQEYGFWLGDAFASGGSAGYDHKKMGITARGAWVSVQRHFRELGIDIQREPITVLGIGDMSGDVFGNGMLLSPMLKLVAAFNHQHIFIDPDPDPATSFAERQRLFALPRSGWSDYQADLISSGGGVFARSAKSIAISPEMQARFAITESRLTPNELINCLLKAPLDLIWNGGIGTYVKARSESHVDVGDKANDSLRVDGAELRARVFGEGGNLGMTQLARVEFALAGGRLNTDFIDNAAGVDCSDHEVNIKILLGAVLAAGDMTGKQRDELLETMTDEVGQLVLRNNYRQTLALSIAERRSSEQAGEQQRFMRSLEERGKLDRAIEFLPDDDSLQERLQQGQGLTRPELATLISYSKIDLNEALIASEVPDNAYLSREVLTPFPEVLRQRFGHDIEAHRLRREIVATQLANHLVNTMGITFAQRIVQATGASVDEFASAYVVVRDVFDLETRWQEVEALDLAVPSELQIELLEALIRLCRRAARWFIRNKRGELLEQTEALVHHYQPLVRRITEHLGQFLSRGATEHWEQRAAQYREQGVPDAVARFSAATRFLFYSLSISEAVVETGQTLEKVARAYFDLGEQLNLHGFSQDLAQLKTDTHWASLARDGIRDELTRLQRSLVVSLLKTPGESLEEQLVIWQQQRQPYLERWQATLAELAATSQPELAMYLVASRQLQEMAAITG